MDKDLSKLSDSQLRKMAFEKLSSQKGKNSFDNMSDNQLRQLAYKKMIQDTPRKEESTTAQAALEGFGQGSTAGYLPQLQAKLEPVTDRVFNLFNDEEVEPAPWSQLYSNDENYLKSRDSNIKRIEELAKKNPASFYGSQVAGAVTSGSIATPVQAAMTAKKAAALGGIYGVLSNPGDVEGVVEELQVAPRLKNALIGTLTGYGAQKGLDVIAEKAKPLAKKIAKLAERRAAKALGMQKHLSNKLTQDQIDDVGRYVLDEDIISPSLWKNTDKMISKNKAAMKKAGESMDDVYRQIDDAGASEFNPLEVAVDVDEKLSPDWRDPLNKAESRQFDNTIESILIRGDKNIPIKEAQALKQRLGNAANWKNNLNVTDKEKMARDAYKLVSKHLDDAVEKGAENIGISGLKNQLQKARKNYSAGKTAEKLLENRANKEQGNNFISLTDFIVGSAGASSMGPAGLALVGVKKIADKYGSQVTAKFLDKVAKGISKTPKLAHLPDKNPAAFQALMFRMASKLEGSLGKRALTTDTQELKGRDRWIATGLDKVSRNKSINLKDPKVINKLLMNKKGEQLLIEASEMKPNSRGMSGVMKKIEQHLKEERK